MTSAVYSSQTAYVRESLESDIVHIGFGAFHRGHQAVYNDLTNELSDAKWGICEINMFGPADLIDDLKAQDHLFSVVEKSASETHTRLVRTICESIHTPVDGIDAAIQKMCEPAVKIVSLTITEKGYCVDPQAGTLDFSNPLIENDLRNPNSPKSAIALICETLRLRRDKGLKPFSVLSCDNIPENGHLTKNAVLAFASAVDKSLGIWIEENVSFPSTMVDRIVPAMTPDQFEVIQKETNYLDPCGVVTEDFRQWVIEDNFVAGRPDWDKAGAMFVSDVLPYEEMKLRMLNGSHSFLAYNGSLAGYEFIYQCMEDEALKATTLRLMLEEQAKSLSPALNVDLPEYANLLIARFSNSNIKHKTGQIAMDGSQKLPQRAVDPIIELQNRQIKSACLPVLVAGWMHYVIKLIQEGQEFVDPMADTFSAIVNADTDLPTKRDALFKIEKIFGEHAKNSLFAEQVTTAFNTITEQGIESVINSLATK